MSEACRANHPHSGIAPEGRGAHERTEKGETP